MEPIDGETQGGDGLPGPASRKLQGTTKQKRKSGKRKAETEDGGSGVNLQQELVTPEEREAEKRKAETVKPETGPPVGQVTTKEREAGKRKAETGPSMGQMTPDQLAATKRFLQALFKTVTVAIMLLLSGSLATAEILHPSNHNSLLGHKTAPVQNSTRREDRGEAKVEIQPEESESKPAGGPPLVPCEAVGVGCSNRVPSGFCHFWQHLCIVAPYPDSILGLHQKLDQLLLAFEVQDAGGLAAGRLGAKGEKGGLKMEDDEGRNVFCRAGSHWDVTFAGGRTFHLRHTLGVEYLNYLLHQPWQPISAFDMETTIRPLKASARVKDSIQNNLNADVVRDYLRQLDRLRVQRADAAEDGDLAMADRLDDDIAAIENELNKNRQVPDAGERARDNVRKAINKVVKNLRKGSPAEQAFAQHITQFVSLGYDIAYNQPNGIRWA